MEEHRLPGLPRYVRINTLKIGRNAANRALHEAGYQLCEDSSHPGKRSYHKDADVPDLIVFKPKGKSDISRVGLVGTGETSHMAMLMQNRGRIFAFDRDARRCQLLRQRMKQQGASMVKATHGSFLDADPMDPAYAGVTHIWFELTAALPSWPRRGHTLTSVPAEVAENIRRCCLRSKYPEDSTIGFFLAKFVRQGHTPPPPAEELQAKLEILDRARVKQAKVAAKRKQPSTATLPVAEGEASAEAGGSSPATAIKKPIPSWREERDERKRLAKKSKREAGC
ncbi:hypothetical protein AB1Y20_013897 [Prymnesium parvum]|uniref:NOL1/NOP2/NSUN 5/7 ferredoxin-like domain-containing protein n=1 Tax=Prymnesium parvum TaxID=97485 RepID=A0AB34IHB1_PRYPA